MSYPLPDRYDAARLYHSEHGILVFCPTTGQMYRPSAIHAGMGGGVLWCACTECDAARNTRETGLCEKPQPHVYWGLGLCTF